MKMIMLNVNPHKKFNKEKEKLIKIQIDNSLELGWKVEDIILATNFPYEYKGVKSIIVGDDNYCGLDDKRYCFKVSSHISTIDNLFRMGVIQDGLYWYHDIDAYQLIPITEEDVAMGKADMALADYGWSNKWNLGAIFFTNKAEDLFKLLKETIYQTNVADERSFRMLTTTGLIPKERYKKLNITYNLGMRNVEVSYEKADKPIKVIHFHPMYKDINISETTMNIFRHGKNKMGVVLMNERLMRIFDSHGFDENYGTKATYNDFVWSIDYE